eukprot:Blabericola_migrator_1__13091@NODE_88_length_14618_cov_150_951275_g79_i0_p6_GENE_NODE_88_length_14618_cov_150_951275_g79_i0NODE_88_length_14618_cov_150_951275_g79_i0_p6_ORF_typecomplete_len441_score77_23Autophagy_N/PF03986_13/1_6e33Autophagy_act_C/PF03987_15/3_3e23Autophagy_C/PF10381_9/9_3e03Autophagy_C/PF10381_9/3_9e09DUF4611/PF15387_6/0_22Dehydrin/PF00257_19/0_53Dehydrin/PF00257_19/4_1e02DNA_pol_phi/PF04931_13/0_91_NODE_88_length_14618_cov_150_951275_g79_i01126412586
MNRAHRLADQFRNVVGWLGRVPTESQFVQKGFLTPAEFVEAGDELVYQCPSWQWQSCPTKKNQVFWLPPNKQYLLTRNIPCRHRVGDWDNTLFRQSRVTSEGWLVPGPQPASSAATIAAKKAVLKDLTSQQCTVRMEDDKEIEVNHQQESGTSSSDSDDDDDEEEEEGVDEATRVNQRFATPNDDFIEIDASSISATVADPLHSRLTDMLSRTASQIPGCAKLLPHNTQAAPSPSLSASVMDDDFCLIGAGKRDDEGKPFSVEAKLEGSEGKPQTGNKKKGKKKALIPTRSYDLSITYDKYYQSPRLWLFGYDESGVPLRADAVFEDIHTDYLSKTVTVDPHPFTGVPTVSVHPCKHASVMKTVAQNWLRSGMQPRHDLALFVLLKMVSSVVPTINYDFTIDIEMPLGRPGSNMCAVDGSVVSNGLAKDSDNSSQCSKAD